MKVYELLAELTNRHQDAEVLLRENGAIITIESFMMKDNNEKAVVMIGKSLPTGGAISRGPIADALARTLSQPDKRFTARIYESAEEPGKYHASIDGVTLTQPFDSELEAKAYLRGYVFGFTIGAGSAPTML